MEISMAEGLPFPLVGVFHRINEPFVSVVVSCNFVQEIPSQWLNTFVYFYEPANCWCPNIRPFNPLWPPFLRRRVKSTRWFQNLSRLSLTRSFSTIWAAKAVNPARAGFISVYTGDIANIGIDPDALARPSALRYQHSTIIEGVWDVFLWRDEEIDVACLAPVERLIVLIFIAGCQIYEFAQGQFLLLDRQEDRIKLVSNCLAFFGGPAWLREESTSKSSSFSFRRFEPWRDLRLMDLVRLAKASSSKRCQGLSAWGNYERCKERGGHVYWMESLARPQSWTSRSSSWLKGSLLNEGNARDLSSYLYGKVTWLHLDSRRADNILVTYPLPWPINPSRGLACHQLDVLLVGYDLINPMYDRSGTTLNTLFFHRMRKTYYIMSIGQFFKWHHPLLCC